MNKCFDIHAHLLPGVDDGAADLNMAMDMLEMYREQGVTHIMVTPHYQAFLEDCVFARNQFLRLCERAKDQFPEISLYLGAEILFTPYDLEENLYDLRNGTLPSLNGTRYVLTEFLPSARRPEVRHTIIRLIEENWIPVIAHAERIRSCFTDITFARQMVEIGALIQINAYSLEKDLNALTRFAARQLLEHGLVHFIGSDAHRTNHRPPDIKAGVRYLAEHTPNADEILFANAEKCFLAERT